MVCLFAYLFVFLFIMNMKSMSPFLFIGGTYEVGEKPIKATYVFARGNFNK